MASLGQIDPNAQMTSSIPNKRAKIIDTSKLNANEPKKRKSHPVEEPHDIPEIDDNDPRLYEIQDTCNQVRNKIRDFIGGGNMRVGEFQSIIGVSPQAYRRFMNQTGTYEGDGCDTYFKAYTFFEKRELQGIKVAPPKRTKKSEEKKAMDVDDIKLDGEETEEVPVYDTCDEIRKEIRAFLRKPNISQAGFCREIAKSFPGKCNVQSRQLNAFLGKKGPMSGNTSCVFYGALCIF
ncbi:uncharacterized protein F4822DRAFT_429900 [Hypoxylon trugodes]|uniref:uncharacterized protein n=1 Tax=Hypoxylon trugodes TaxID=326681 RepID=UPI00218EB43F|nr:uncharacterized protein F4822DRAFT_429900 [Hypoxylon trugodes]KAI1387139.1 hypothetical protein F4822DRAFT_429900 [Hypoxylon trugodes]